MAIFSQPQGPVIPISLFGDAAIQGAEVGHATPTNVTAALRGASEGFQTGLDTTEKLQNIEIRQDQIDNQPTETKIREEYAKNLELKNKEQELDTEFRVKNDNLITEDKIATLDTHLSELNRKKTVNEQVAVLANDYQKWTPQQQLAAISSGKFSALMLEKPALQEQLLQGLSVNRDLPASDRVAIEHTLSKYKLRDQYQKNKLKYEEDYVKAYDEFANDQVTGQISSKLGGLDPSLIYPNLTFAEVGTFQTVPGTNELIPDVKGGGFLSNDINTAGAKEGTIQGLEVVYTDPNTGKGVIVASGISAKYESDRGKVLTADRLRSGAAMVDQINILNKNFANQNKAQPQSFMESYGGGRTSDVSQTETQSQAEARPYREQVAKSALGITDNTLKNIAPSLERIEASITESIRNPRTRGVDAAMLQSAYVESLSKKVAYSQYDENPAIRSQYTEGDVIEYNKALREEMRRSSDPVDRYTDTTYLSSRINPFLAQTPKDLYYQKQRKILEKNVSSMMNVFIRTANEKVTAPAKKQTNFNSALSKVSSGGS